MTHLTPEPTAVTRIATRYAKPSHEHEYEDLVREMFSLMREKPGFLGADLIPPEEPGQAYHVVVRYRDDTGFAAWDDSPERQGILERMHAVAEGEPTHRRLTGLEAWFEPAVVPATMTPPRHRMGFVTWVGIWPTATLFIWLLSTLPVLPDGRPLLAPVPFLLRTAIITVSITVAMTYLVMPRLLTPLFKGWLAAGARKAAEKHPTARPSGRQGDGGPGPGR
ncbi:antibiotic biosynthesis monooxygenase [Raineyella fluvialis]|uniref:Antibiotic biosynthesis monooxygenase n=1 Tax=Raineyella fluvialis TaxID=2662261 RepID=A0A5Q2FHK7_9ACTN|nr:antibiotic biosynthesis monooxygenase [Raineyella fluvialis]QGF24623.1 antibiotic biosynthesis monooxygenase [Raineyella fluvialis]